MHGFLLHVLFHWSLAPHNRHRACDRKVFVDVTLKLIALKSFESGRDGFRYALSDWRSCSVGANVDARDRELSQRCFKTL